MEDDRRANPALPILVLVAALAAGGLYWLATKPGLQPTPQASLPTTAAVPPAASEGGPPGPKFDIVRVDPQGNLVVAGHAAPGATVTIKSGDAVLGTAVADSSGAFAFIPGKPLPAGAQQLTLSETVNGQTISSQASAAVMGGLAVANNGAGASTVLTGQGPRPGQLGIGTVDYDAQGHAIFSGTAPAGATVKVAIGGVPLGTATAGADGTWHLQAPTPKSAGALTATIVDANGQPVQTDTVTFAPAALPAALAAGHVVIRPGNNLWTIARNIYGRGILYTTIYQANANQIHDPNLIYPGQTLRLPKSEAIGGPSQSKAP
jgi:nucleoid-associated protein YgaU